MILCLMNLAGFPPTTAHASTLCVTVEFAAMTAKSPMLTPWSTVTPVVIQQPLPMVIGFVINSK